MMMKRARLDNSNDSSCDARPQVPWQKTVYEYPELMGLEPFTLDSLRHQIDSIKSSSSVVTQPISTSNSITSTNSHNRKHATAAEIIASIKHSRYLRRMKRVKRAVRSELDLANWGRSGYASRWCFWIHPHRDTLRRIAVKEVTVDEFIENYERPALPVVITGITEIDGWRVKEEWTPERLIERFHSEKFKVGEDDDGNSVFVQFSHFMYYCIISDGCDTEDSPLYIFDGNFGERKRTNTAEGINRKRRDSKNSMTPNENSSTISSEISQAQLAKSYLPILADNMFIEPSTQNQTVPDISTKFTPAITSLSLDTALPSNLACQATKIQLQQPLKITIPFASLPPLPPPPCPTKDMLSDYCVPPYFRDDLFQYTGTRRPPYRWVVIGPARSGTGIHIDPLGTSAWNTLVFGHKRWALFPPHIPKHLVTLRGLPDSEASTWFTHVYPRLVDESTLDKTGLTEAERLEMVEIMQKPGETVFVPGGWHHVVINLDFTIAITQNFCSITNFESVWLKTRHARPRLARKLLHRLETLSESSSIPSSKGFAACVESTKLLETIPAVPTSSSSSGSSSSSSSSGSDDVDEDSNDTESESDAEDGTCMCRKCKIKRRRAIARGLVTERDMGKN